MADLTKSFEAAVANSKNLSERPDNATLLKIYALYKQGSIGDNTEKKPGFGDMVGRAKWDAWNGVKGKSTDVSFPLAVKKDGATQVFDGALPIKRLTYNVGEGEWKDTGMVADEVTIKFHIVAQ